MPEIGLFEAMYTMRAIRRFRPDPVPQELIEKLIEAATRAPSGANRQPWAFVVVRDPELKRPIAALYHDSWEAAYGNRVRGGARPLDSRVYASATHLAAHMAEAPALIFVCLDHQLAGGILQPGQPTPAGRYTSILPAVQNLLLAARGLGLGAVLTTLHKTHEEEIKLLLGIPHHVETVALIPVGYPLDKFGPVTRRPPSEVTFYERWGSTAQEA